MTERRSLPHRVPEAVCQSLKIELVGLFEQLQNTNDIATIKGLLKQIAVVEQALKHCPELPEPPEPPSYPDLSTWLLQHQNVSKAIKWQFQPADMNNAYAAPTENNKVAWPNWTPVQKAELNQVYLDTCVWFDAGAHQVQLDPNGLTDAPTNTNPNVAGDGLTVMEGVSPDYMWNLYLAHVGFSLAAELTQRLPWSITGYDDMGLRYLFDSTTMAWNLFNSYYEMGTYSAFVPAKRADNLPKTPFAPPEWMYPFLKQGGLIAPTRLETIGAVLDWMRHNLWHFFGQDTFGNCFAVWQYRGYPPLSRIVTGTVDTNNQGLGAHHWTMGCHGSVGLLNAVLRVVNIPVQPVWIAGHELAYFMTEKMYMDHGDDPYNQNVKNSMASILNVLIDEPTYQARFTNDLTANITDPNSPALMNVGLSAAQFP